MVLSLNTHNLNIIIDIVYIYIYYIYYSLSQDRSCKKNLSIDNRVYVVDKILIRHTLVMKQKVSEHRAVGAMGCRKNELSEQWVYFRNYGLSFYMSKFGLPRSCDMKALSSNLARFRLVLVISFYNYVTSQNLQFYNFKLHSARSTMACIRIPLDKMTDNVLLE